MFRFQEWSARCSLQKLSVGAYSQTLDQDWLLFDYFLRKFVNSHLPGHLAMTRQGNRVVVVFTMLQSYPHLTQERIPLNSMGITAEQACIGLCCNIATVEQMST